MNFTDGYKGFMGGSSIRPDQQSSTDVYDDGNSNRGKKKKVDSS